VRIRHLKPKPKPREPDTPQGWVRLMRRVLARAKKLRDRRVPGLEEAVRKGQIRQALKRMSIICEPDILREFPDP